MYSVSTAGLPGCLSGLYHPQRYNQWLPCEEKLLFSQQSQAGNATPTHTSASHPTSGEADRSPALLAQAKDNSVSSVAITYSFKKQGNKNYPCWQ